MRGRWGRLSAFAMASMDVTSKPLFFSEAYAERVDVRTVSIFYYITLSIPIFSLDNSSSI